LLGWVTLISEKNQANAQRMLLPIMKFQLQEYPNAMKETHDSNQKYIMIPLPDNLPN
jgi:hypothetical protein